jgi:hypothetical protein
VVAAITIADASNPSATLFIATSHNHAASLFARRFRCWRDHAVTGMQRQAAGYFRKTE